MLEHNPSMWWKAKRSAGRAEEDANILGHQIENMEKMERADGSVADSSWDLAFAMLESARTLLGVAQDTLVKMRIDQYEEARQ